MQRLTQRAVQRTAEPDAPRASESAARTNFAEWAAAEVERLLRERATATSPEERVQLELKIAVVCDAAHRFGRSLLETAEL